MLKSKLKLIIFLLPICFSQLVIAQSIKEKNKCDYLILNDSSIYLYGLKNKQLFISCKYNLDLQKIGEYKKEIPKSAYRGYYNCYIDSNQVVANFQYNKRKLLKANNVQGGVLKIDINLNLGVYNEIENSRVYLNRFTNEFSSGMGHTFSLSYSNIKFGKPYSESILRENHGVTRLGTNLVLKTEEFEYEIANCKTTNNSHLLDGFFILKSLSTFTQTPNWWYRFAMLTNSRCDA
jgi:hypothetical protein